MNMVNYLENLKFKFKVLSFNNEKWGIKKENQQENSISSKIPNIYLL